VHWQRSSDRRNGDDAAMTSAGEMTSLPVSTNVITSTAGVTSTRRVPVQTSSCRRRRRRAKRRPVYLWQFLRDLLQLPQRYHAGVRWIDRDTGQSFVTLAFVFL